MRSHREFFGLATVAFLGYLAHTVLPGVSVLYMGYRYGWGTASVGMMMAGVGVAAMVVQGGLIRPITNRFGERRTVLIGLLGGALGFFVYGIAPEGWIFCLGIPVMAFWGIAGPATQSLMTRRVSSGEQGQLQGAIAGIHGVTGLIGPTLLHPDLRLLHPIRFCLQQVSRIARRTVHPSLAYAPRRRCDCVADDENGRTIGMLCLLSLDEGESDAHDDWVRAWTQYIHS